MPDPPAARFCITMLPYCIAVPYTVNTLLLIPVAVLVPIPTLLVNRLRDPPTLMLPAIPAPPVVTINAPVPVLVLALALLTVTFCPNNPYTLLINVLTVAVSVALITPRIPALPLISNVLNGTVVLIPILPSPFNTKILSTDTDLKPSKSLLVVPSKSVSIVNLLLLSLAWKYILASSAPSPPRIAISPVTSNA